MKKLFFFIFAILITGYSWGQTTIVSDGLNSSTSLFTLSGGGYYTGNSTAGDKPASSPFASEGSHSRGVTNATATLTSSDINTASYSGVELSFRLAAFSISSTTNGVDVADFVKVEISPDGGTNYYNTIQVKGNSNAYWSYIGGTGIASTAYDGNATAVDFQPSGSGNRTTDGYSTVKITGLPSISNLRVRISLTNDATSERWVIDDFKVTGTLNPITTGAISSSIFCIDATNTASGTVAFTSNETFSNATLTAYLSDANGSFASPVNIGTTTVNGVNPSGNINITIPANTTSGAGYKIRIDCASPALTGSESAAFEIINGAKNVSSVAATSGVNTSVLTWTNPSGCYEEIMIVAKTSSSISGTPSGDGTTYSANLAFGSGTAFDGGFVVYKGTASSQTVTGLTNGTTYYFKFYTRKGSNWSAGIETSATPDYCKSNFSSNCINGATIKSFSLNTLINNNSGCNGGTGNYINYPTSSFTTTLKETETYNTSVTIGSYGTGNVNIWIDFNNNGVFETSERFVNSARINADATTTIAITCPVGSSGTRRMRAIFAYNAVLTTIDPCISATYGETEDYTITIIPYDLPRLSTTDASGISQTTATLGGEITELNGTALTERGIVYSTTASVTIANGTKIIDASLGLGTYAAQITGLQDNKTYYFKAYATNANNITTYGTEKSFTTLSVAAPIAISATNPAANSFTANWNATEGATSYKLDVSTLAAFGTSGTAVNDGFESATFPSTNWITTGWTRSTTSGDYKNGNAAAICGSNNGTLTTPALSNPASLSFYLGRSSNATAKTLTIEVSTTSQTAGFTTVATYNHSNVPVSSYDLYVVDLSAYSSYSTVYIRFNKTSSTTSPWRLDDVNVSFNSPSFVTGYNDLNVAGNTNTQDIAGLSANTTYYYRVRANGTNSNSGNSNVVSTAITDGVVNWSSLANTSSTTDITVANNSTLTLDAATNCKSITVMNGGKLTRNSSTTLTLNGGTLSIKNGGSFVDNGSGDLAATMEREISAANWNSTDEGWHVLSSPVVGQGVSGVFTPTGTNNDYDFYAWDEENYTWLNQKIGANNINTFGNAIGYLVAYQQAGTKTFAGNLNNANVNVTLSYANTTANKKGWNLLGNPYPCALDWSNAAWNKSKIDGAKIWNSTTKNWVDISLATTPNIIPANQGFIVKANSAGSFTIPAAARIHSGQGFYKSTSDMLILKAEKTGTTFNDVMGIDFNSSATLAFDTQKDAIEFETFGDAPSLYSVLSGGENVSINAVPAQLPASTVINLNFKARTNGQYSINATAIPSIPACTTLLLEDSKNNVTHNLKLNPVYNFTAATTDNINRFKLHFQTFTGIEEAENNSTLVYVENAKIFISSNLKIKSIEVYNKLGQQLSDYQVNGNNFNFSSKGKIQIIRIVTDNGIIVRKVLNL